MDRVAEGGRGGSEGSAQHPTQFFEEPRNQELVEKLRSAGLVFYACHQAPGSTDGTVGGTDVCTDRHIADMSREEAKERIEAAGGKVTAVGQQEDSLS